MGRDYRLWILDNAAELRRLQARVDETFARRGDGPEARRAWDQSTAEFHARYDALAFPGGLSGVFERLLAGDEHTMEAALVFLEQRPYFFRSGYIQKKLLRYAKRAPFSGAQAQRLRVVLERSAEWRAISRDGRALSLEELFQLLESRGFTRAGD
jgi:hypothetical protein